MEEKNRYLPVEADEDLDIPEEVSSNTPVPLEPVKQPVKIFEMSVWKEAPEERDGVVLASYIEQLYKEGHSPEEISKITQLPLYVVRKKLNQIVNSFLGRPDPDSKGLRRLEVDEYLMKQLHRIENSLSSYITRCTENELIPDVKVITKFQAQITKLLEVRMKLWGLEGGDSVTKSKEKGSIGVAGHFESKIDQDTGNKIANLIIGMVNKEF